MKQNRPLLNLILEHAPIGNAVGIRLHVLDKVGLVKAILTCGIRTPEYIERHETAFLVRRAVVEPRSASGDIGGVNGNAAHVRSGTSKQLDPHEGLCCPVVLTL